LRRHGQGEGLHQLDAALRPGRDSQELKTAKAWAMKELLRHLWEHTSKPAAGRFLSSLIRSLKAMKLPPLNTLAGTLADHRAKHPLSCDPHEPRKRRKASRERRSR
jgi:hypothetical protein